MIPRDAFRAPDVFHFLHVSLYIFLIFIASMIGTTPGNCSDPPSGINVLDLIIHAPAQANATLDSLFSDRDGGIVIEYDLNKTTDDMAYFEDERNTINITAHEARRLAINPRFLEDFARKHDFARIDSLLGGVSEPGRFALTTHEFYAPMCQWPYSTALNIELNNRTRLDVVFLRRLPEPRRVKYKIWCERGPGDVTVTTRFESIVPRIYLDPANRPIISFSQPAIVMRVNENGRNIPKRMPEHVICLQAITLSRIYSKVAEGEMLPQQGINLIEGMALRTERPTEPCN